MLDAVNSRSAAEIPSDAAVAENTTGILGAVIDAYREEGYKRGYENASRELLDSLVAISERFLRTSVRDAQLRQIVYAFVEFLEREIHAASGDVAGYVSGGLGI